MLYAYPLLALSCRVATLLSRNLRIHPVLLLILPPLRTYVGFDRRTLSAPPASSLLFNNSLAVYDSLEEVRLSRTRVMRV